MDINVCIETRLVTTIERTASGYGKAYTNSVVGNVWAYEVDSGHTDIHHHSSTDCYRDHFLAMNLKNHPG